MNRKLEDSEAAERYCAELGRPEAYMQLVFLCLKLSPPKAILFLNILWALIRL